MVDDLFGDGVRLENESELGLDFENFENFDIFLPESTRISSTAAKNADTGMNINIQEPLEISKPKSPPSTNNVTKDVTTESKNLDSSVEAKASESDVPEPAVSSRFSTISSGEKSKTGNIRHQSASSAEKKRVSKELHGADIENRTQNLSDSAGRNRAEASRSKRSKKTPARYTEYKLY